LSGRGQVPDFLLDAQAARPSRAESVNRVDLLARDCRHPPFVEKLWALQRLRRRHEPPPCSAPFRLVRHVGAVLTQVGFVDLLGRTGDRFAAELRYPPCRILERGRNVAPAEEVPYPEVVDR
jgi:hypothetical protein